MAPLLSWSVTADRTANVRRTMQAVFAPGARRGLDGVTVQGTYVQLDVGIDYLDGSEELIPQGRFRLDEEDAALPVGGISVKGYGREKAVIDDKFLIPRTERNSSALDLIEALLLESVPTATVLRRSTRDAVVSVTTWERERWEAIDGTDASLARSVGVEVWADGTGQFVISRVPTLSDPPVWTVDTGDGGALITAAASTSTAGLYNIVVAIGDASNGSTPIGPVIVQDADPTSPTRVSGPMGRRPRHYSSPLLRTAAQADTAARSLLSNSLGLSAGLSFSALPNPALEPGDVVRVVPDDRPAELHIIDKLTLSSTGAMQCETRSTRADDGT
ncbi:DUF5047 domain-containing protein [Streptomyces sp. NPDC058657]|uniref:DUF5047 domain-containing protein n=1 Tax=Streptomyces sp. NPDC058657 TaxID=3346579 RepID=UPI0036474196